ncbi:MAG TPA: OmpW family outer membrane protein [Thermoanaerobaculia bacterium]|nr:OmpW family outer membrane protein [Thermoanaerobaculia bacterium]
MAGGCKTTSTTTTSSLNNQPALQSGETGTITTGVTPTVTTNTTSYSTPSYSTPAATTLTTTTTTPSTTTDANGTTTTTMANGSTVTRSETTTVVYPDGTVKTLTPNESAALGTTTAPNGTQLVNMPAGSAVVTKTVTTITTPPPQNTIVTTTVPVTQQPPMTSSTTSIAYPYPAYNTTGRRIPGLDFLVFANRASFSQTNSFPGTLNTGDIRTDIRNQTGYGIGINAWFNRHFSGEITASRIHPQTSFIPSDAGVNPITGLRVKMTPITGTLQLHFNPYSTVDAYLGGGAAYVLFKADQTFNPGTTGLTSINFRDEWGPLVNGGLGFNISRHFGINLDAKYMWIRARANTTFNNATIGNVGNNERWGLNPFVISAGLRFGF